MAESPEEKQEMPWWDCRLFGDRSVRVWQVLGGIAGTFAAIGGAVLFLVDYIPLLAIITSVTASIALLAGAVFLWKRDKQAMTPRGKLAFLAALALMIAGAGSLGGTIIALGTTDASGTERVGSSPTSSPGIPALPSASSTTLPSASSTTGNTSPSFSSTVQPTESTTAPATSTSEPAPNPPVDIDDPPSWRIPQGMTGTWTGSVVSVGGTTRYQAELILDQSGVGKGSKVGWIEWNYGSGQCVSDVFLAELRVGEVVYVDSGSAIARCADARLSAGDRYKIDLRQDGRLALEIEGRQYTGALVKVG